MDAHVVHLSEADRHMAEAESRVERIREFVVGELERDGDPNAAAIAGELLTIFEHVLDQMHAHRRMLLDVAKRRRRCTSPPQNS